MRERALLFGESATLVGILTEPDPAARRPDAPAVLFLNSGIIHRVGASRLYVRMARRLAEEGFTSLRFDYSGIGDSEARRDALPFRESAAIETREAMDHLGRITGATRFVLGGLCSGADMAYFVGVDDERVVGLVQLDPFAYRTAGWFVRRYGPRVLRPSAWTNAVRVRVRALRERVAPEATDGASSVFVAPEYRRVFPPRREVAAGLRAMAGRGVRFFVCFSGDEEAFNHPAQYARSFRGVPFGDRLRVVHMAGANHTFTGLEDQDRVVALVGEWAAASLGSPVTSGRDRSSPHWPPGASSRPPAGTSAGPSGAG